DNSPFVNHINPGIDYTKLETALKEDIKDEPMGDPLLDKPIDDSPVNGNKGDIVSHESMEEEDWRLNTEQEEPQNVESPEEDGLPSSSAR
ncbi:hypothetical protein PENTCL1PPCAC_23629, partial [Pristionchus entomophagus]